MKLLHLNISRISALGTPPHFWSTWRFRTTNKLITLANSYNLLTKHMTHLIHLDGKLSSAECQKPYSVIGDPKWRSQRATWLGLNIKAWLDQPLLIKKSLMILGIWFVWLACYIHNDCCDKKEKKKDSKCHHFLTRPSILVCAHLKLGQSSSHLSLITSARKLC